MVVSNRNRDRIVDMDINLNDVSFDEFTDEVDPAEIKDRLEKITAYGEQLRKLFIQAAEIQEVLSEKNREIKRLSEDVLPELLNDANMQSFMLSNGTVVELKDNIMGMGD